MIAKKVCLQKRICHRLALSKDLTIKPPKLKQKAPKKISNGPGIILINLWFLLKKNRIRV